jgi:CheY-like chemotaxis protein
MQIQKRILIVDDDIDDQQLFCEAIRRKHPGYLCEIAGDALQAIHLVDQSPPFDFIFLDLHMPKMNGFECLAVLKNHPNTRDTHLVILSTSSRIADIETCMALGATTYLIKSSTFQGLQNMLQDLLSEVVKR